MYSLKDDIFITNETIAIQDDPVFTGKLESIIEKLLMIFMSDSSIKSKDYRRNDRVNKELGKLEKLLTDRFGIPYRIIGTDNLAYTIPLTGSLDSIIDFKRMNLYETFKTIKELQCKTKNKDGECDVSTMDMTNIIDEPTLQKNELILMTTLKNGMDVFSNLFINTGVKVDLNKAYISGLTKVAKKHKLSAILALDFRSFIRYNFNVADIAGVILHEVGHNFMDIAYANMFSKTSFPVIQSLVNDSTLYTDDAKVTVSYKKLTGNIATPEEARKMLAIKIAEDAMPNKSNLVSFYNSEITADQFAARFGYGKNVVMTLNNIEITHDRLKYPGLSVLAGFILVLFALIVAIVSVFLTFYILLYAFKLIFTPPIKDTSDPHEKSFARIHQMKLELIRQIRTGNYKGIPLDVIEDISELDRWLDGNGVDKRTYQLFTTVVFRGQGKEIGYHELYERLESLSENDLHHMVAKLKTIKM